MWTHSVLAELFVNALLLRIVQKCAESTRMQVVQELNQEPNALLINLNETSHPQGKMYFSLNSNARGYCLCICHTHSTHCMKMGARCPSDVDLYVRLHLQAKDGLIFTRIEETIVATTQCKLMSKREPVFFDQDDESLSTDKIE